MMILERLNELDTTCSGDVRGEPCNTKEYANDCRYEAVEELRVAGCRWNRQTYLGGRSGRSQQQVQNFEYLPRA
jgi:hypothetical protein